jgi:rapA
MLLGYVSIAYPQIRIAKEAIKNIKNKYNYKDEFKWTSVHQATYKVYAELVDWFFMNDLEFRAVVVDKSQIDESRPDYTFNDFYYKMYFQLLHTKVDFQNTYNVYMDIKDTCSSEKLSTLKRIMDYNSSIGNLQFIRSHESVFIQLADVLMGAINYNLRKKKGDVEGRVDAKIKLIEKIQKHSNISLNCSTPLYRKKFNLFFISLK